MSKSRAFQTRDWPAYVALYNLTHILSPTTENDAQGFAERFKDDLFEAFVLEQNSQLIASARAYKGSAGAHQARFELLIHPNEATSDLRAALYNHLLQRLKPRKLTNLTTTVRETWEDWLAFYERVGFSELERQWSSRLDVNAFDPTPFEKAFEKAEAANITFKTLADLPDTEATQRLIYNTISKELLPDVPFTEPLDIWPFEVWQERFWSNPHRNSESVFLAFDEDVLVGYSELYKTNDPKKFSTGLTAVKRTHRRKGIALSLKLKAAAYARGAGATEITTVNHIINRPMLSINEAMGFEKDPAWITLKKELA